MKQNIINDDIEGLCTAVSKMPPGIIVFDGFMGAGKTRQAAIVAAHLRYEHIDCDQYYGDPDTGIPFVDAIRQNAAGLRDRVKTALESSNKILISTICGRDIIKFIKPRKVNVSHIYVEYRLPGLKNEVIEYHFMNNPRAKADLIYHRIEDDVERAAQEYERMRLDREV